MSFNVNMKQPPKPKINMRDKGSITDNIGIDGNALSQKSKEVTDVEFGNSVRDKLLQKQIEAIRNDVIVRVDNIETQVENISISTEQLSDKVDSLDTKVNQLEDDVEHIDVKIDEKINVEKEARIEADNQLQESIDEIDEKIEHLDKYIEKSTIPGLVKNDGTIDETKYASQSDLDSAKDDLQEDIDDLGTELRQSISNEEGTRQAQDEILQQNIDDVSGRVDDVEDTLDTPLKSWVYDKQEGMTMQPVFTVASDYPTVGTMYGTARTIANGSSSVKTIYNDTTNNIKITMSLSTLSNPYRMTVTYYVGNDTYILRLINSNYGYYTDWTQSWTKNNLDISSQEDLPILVYDESNITSDYLDAKKTFLKYAVNPQDNKTLMSDVIDSINQDILDETSARQNADNQLQNAIDTKAQEITIINQQITNWFINENQDFSNYAYVSNTTIQDLINAKYVNVSFSLSDLEANNICPIQVVDNTLGVITIYSNDNSLITIPYIYIFK